MVSERTCVGCRKRFPRQQLIRFVRDGGAGSLRADLSRSGQGRGVYACPDRQCLAQASKRGGFARGLRVEVRPDAEKLIEVLRRQVERRVEELLRRCEQDGRARKLERDTSRCAENDPGWVMRWGDEVWRLSERHAARCIERLERLHGRLLG